MRVMMMRALPVLLSLAAFSGCGGGGDDGSEGELTPDAGDRPDATAPDGVGGRDAGPEPCDTEGAMRGGPCGMCGTQSQQCSGGVWQGTGPCLAEGECAAGSLEARATGRCGEETRLCTDACAWLAWESTTPDGDCAPGETRTGESTECAEGETILETCSEVCAWEPTGTCLDACGDHARATPGDAAEICIPAGPFIRGEDGLMTGTPAAEITLSAYYVGKYPVTNERYRACMTAGACSRPELYSTFVDDPARARFPVQGLFWADAVAFCDWDGGRRLLTSAEWEKAARGPAPRAQPYTWDGPEYRCDLLDSGVCGWTHPSPDVSIIAQPINAFPGAASYYGVQTLHGGGYDWVQDWYDAGYYADPASRVPDPQGPTSGTYRVTRGMNRGATVPRSFNVALQQPASPTSAHQVATIRCARSAPGVGTTTGGGE